MASGLCLDCGKNLALVGRAHLCIARRLPVVNAALAVTELPNPLLTASGAERSRKWRKANAELNRVRAREGMKNRRAKAKTET